MFCDIKTRLYSLKLVPPHHPILLEYEAVWLHLIWGFKGVMVDRFSDPLVQDGRRWLILWAGLVSIVRLYIYLLLWPDYGQIYGSINRVKSRLRLTRFEGTVTLTNRRKSKTKYGE